ncbi:MAG: hypothetical protein M1418_03145 [Deltaproteobacteria bacterium]|nr:hypothetical protein [Deltaproteobacteria bacterium]
MGSAIPPPAPQMALTLPARSCRLSAFALTEEMGGSYTNIAGFVNGEDGSSRSVFIVTSAAGTSQGWAA